MKAYFDTSLIVTMTLMEDRWMPLARWITDHMPKPYYSDFGWGEFISAVGLKVRRNELSSSDGSNNVAAVEDYLASWSRARTRRSDLLAAADMIRDFNLGLRFPDAIHIATARRLEGVLVTGDKKQHAAACQLGVSTINPYEHIGGDHER